MLDKLTDNIKFFIMLLVYVVYLTWWASDINRVVKFQIEIQQKTVTLLDSHIKECKEKDIRNIVIAEDLKHLKLDVQELKLDVSTLKKKHYKEDFLGTK